MHFGADYYPEYWPRERWAVDAYMMRKAGFDIVRIGEFAWRVLEPEEGRYDFELFDAAIATLAKEGVRVMLCTPTAAMPAWVEQRYPDVNVEDVNGRRRSWGARKNWCYNNPQMQQLSRNITRSMAEHYAGNPNVLAWQTDNEFHYSGCYCPHCVAEFRRWLAEHYASPDALNEAWGLRFWSMDIHDWSEMIPPRELRGASPSHMLAYRRFQSDAILAFNREQAQIIRAADPQAKVTHNYMGLNSGIDYLKMAADLDFVSNDMYPRHIGNLPASAYAHDVIRGYNGGAGFWMNELQCGYINRENQLRTPPPGMIRLWTHQAIAHGADAIIYFRWRSCTGGCEQFHSGIVQHDGSAQSRSYQEIAAIGEEIGRLRELGLAGSEVRNEVAILRSFDQCRALELYRNDKLFDYDAEIQRYYRALARLNVGVDVVHPEADLFKYRAVFAPLMMLTTPAQVAHLRAYVESGGTLVTSFRLGAYDWNAVVPTETLPGDALAELFGVRIHEYDCLMADVESEAAPVILWDGKEHEAQVWADMLEPTTAEVLAEYSNSWYTPYAAITRNRAGKGQAIYVGAALEDAFYAGFVRKVLGEAGVSQEMETPEGVSAKVRWVNGQPITFVLNLTKESKVITLPQPMVDVLLDRAVGTRFVLGPRDVVALR